MWRLIDRWDDLIDKRKETAKYLLENWDNREDLPEAAHELLGTFEVLGYLVIVRKSETSRAAPGYPRSSGRSPSRSGPPGGSPGRDGRSSRRR
jgi:hypothetical protein